MSGHNTGAVLEGKITRRGTSNRNDRGNTMARRARREWLVATYAADVDVAEVRFDDGEIIRHPWSDHLRAVVDPWRLDRVSACRCYRCGTLLTVDTVTVDRIIPGCKGGTYRRSNIRPACGHCNSETGGHLGASRRLT